MRKASAGLLVGCTAAAIVLAVDLLFTRFTSGLHPLEAVELKTYDWRLSHTARPDTARQDIALVEIDEYSLRNLQPNAGRWPWPRAVHSMLIDYLARAPAKVIAYDVNFAEADTRVRASTSAATTWSGAESDKALADSVKAAGNVILLADATYDGAAGRGAAAAGPRLHGSSAPGIIEREGGLSAVRGARAVPRPVSATTCSCSTPTDRFGTSCRSSAAQQRALPSLGHGGRAACRRHRLRRRPARADRPLRHGRSARCRSRGGACRTAGRRPRRYLWGLINFRGPRAARRDLKSRTYPTYSFFDLLYSEEQLLARQKPNDRPVGVQGQDRLRRHDGVGPVRRRSRRRSRTGKMPGIQIHAGGGRRHPVQPLHAPGVGPAFASRSVVAGALVVGAGGGAAAGVVGDAGRRSRSWRSWPGGRRACSPAAYWLNLTQPVLGIAVRALRRRRLSVLRRRAREAEDEDSSSASTSRRTSTTSSSPTRSWRGSAASAAR